MMRRMADAIPGAHYVELDGCGHLANLERSREFDAALCGFLDTLA
jgi:3-oxoadipate enol-lactonase